MKLIIYLAITLILLGCAKENSLRRSVVSSHDSKFSSVKCQYVNSQKNIITKTNILNSMSCFGLENSLDLFDFIEGLSEEEFSGLSFGFTSNDGDAYSKKIGLLLLDKVEVNNIEQINKASEVLLGHIKDSSILQHTYNQHNDLSSNNYDKETKTIIQNSSADIPLAKVASLIKPHLVLFDKLILELKNKRFTTKALEFFQNMYGGRNQTQLVEQVVEYFSQNIQSINVLRSMLGDYENNELKCSTRDLVVLDFDFEFNTFLSLLRTKSKNDFEVYFTSLLTKFTLYKEICLKDKQQVEFEIILGLLGQLLELPLGYDLLYSLGDMADFKIKGFKALLDSKLFNHFAIYLESLNSDEMKNISFMLSELIRVNVFKINTDENKAMSRLIHNDFFLKTALIYEQLADEPSLREEKLKSVLSIKLSNQTVRLIKDFFLINPTLLNKVLTFIFSDSEQEIKLKSKLSQFLRTPVIKGDYLQSNLLESLLGFIRSFHKAEKQPSQVVRPQGGISEEPRELASSCFNQFINNFKTNANFSHLVASTSSICADIYQNDVPLMMIGWNSKTEHTFNELTGKSFMRPEGLVGSKLMRLYHAGISSISVAPEMQSTVIDQLFDFISYEPYFASLEKDLNIVLNSNEIKALVDVALESALSVNSFRFSNAFNELITFRVEDVEDYQISEFLKDSTLSRKPDRKLFSKWTNDLLRPKKRKQFIKNLAMLLEDGNEVIIGNKKKRVYKTSIQSLLEFLFYSTDPKYSKLVNIKNSGKSYQLDLLLSQRVEVLIKEISFSDNYYGAYFMNRIAQTNDYRKEVKKLKKFVTLLNKSDGIMRAMGYFPKDSDERFFNINNTYDSLVELSDQKFGPKSNISIDGFVHALLYTVVTNSPKETQKINPLKKSKKVDVSSHRGKLLTLLSKKSMITKMGLALRHGCKTVDQCMTKYERVSLNNLMSDLAGDDIVDGLDRSIEEMELSPDSFEQLYKKISLEEINEKQLLTSLRVFKSFPTPKFIIQRFLGLIANSEASIKSMDINFFSKNLFLVDMLLKKISIGEKESIYNILMKNKEVIRSAMSPKLVVQLLEIFKNKYKSNLNEDSKLGLRAFFKENALPFNYLSESIQAIYLKDGNFEYIHDLLKLVISKNKEGKTSLSTARSELLKNKEKLREFLLDHFAMFSVLKN